MADKVATHSLLPWRPGDEQELFYNEIGAMVVLSEQTVDLKGQDPLDAELRAALSSLYSTKFRDHVTHFTFEDGANPILDIFIHAMLKWESDKRRLVPLLLVSWRDRRRTADLIRSGQMSESHFVKDANSAITSLSLDVVERFCQVLSENQRRLASVKKHPLKKSQRFTKDWEPSFLVPIYPNGIPTTCNVHLTTKLRAAARDEAHFKRLALEHSSFLLHSRLGIVTRRFFIRKTSTAETHMIDQLGSPTDKLLCDSEGRAYVFEDRGEAGAFALSMDCVDVRGLGDESWEEFRRNVPHVFIKKGSRPALPDAGGSQRTRASKGTKGATALADARALKDQGNAHLQAGDLAKAVDCYAAGVSALEELLSVAATPSETQACEALLLVMASNKAQAHLQAGECGSARAAAERALSLDPSHGKSIVRRVRALCDLGALDDATSAIEKALVLDIGEDARKALEQISARLVARSQPLPKPVGKFLSVDDFMSRDDLLGAILRGLASNTSFITEVIDCREVQARIARDVGSVAADLLRVVLAMKEGHDKQSDLPLSLLNASEVIQMLDKVLNRDHLAPIDKAHTLYLRGVAQVNIREWGAAAVDFEEAYRLSEGQEVWLLVWCARANVEDLVPPRPCQATEDEQMQYRQRGYARAVQNYGMLISALEQSLQQDPEIEGMLVFAFWELAYAKHLALCARWMRTTTTFRQTTREGPDLLRDEWLEHVLPTALRAQEAEAKCVFEIVNCVAKDMVSPWIALYSMGEGGALPPGRPVEVTGLQSRAELNGKRGTLGHFDPVSKRYQVSFADHAPVSIRLINLKLVASGAQSKPQEAPTQGEHPVGPPAVSSPPPQESERGPSLTQEGESESIVLEGLDALRSMQEAGEEKEKRKVEIQEAMQRGDLPDPGIFGVARLHSIMQEERQAINQQRELYEARAEEQKKAADNLQIQAQSLASLKEQWRIKAAELEQEKGDALRWANEEAARQESVLQSRIQQLESEKDQETNRLRNSMATLTKELERMTQTLDQVEKDFQGKLQTAKAEHTQAQEALEVVLAEREEFQCHIARRRREAEAEWQRIRVLQGSIEEAEAELQTQRRQIQEGEKRLCSREREVEEQRRKLHEVKNSLGFNVGSPKHWSQLADPQQLNVDRITDAHLLGLLQQALVCQKPDEWLGQGADVRQRGMPYNHIGLCEAWRVQHLSMWHKYCAEVSKMQSELASNGLTAPSVAIRDDLQKVTRQLPGPALNGRVCETFLLHGTTRETVLSLLQDGFNERFNRRANFGYGSYLAEDAGKCDQYLARDESYNPAEPLHNLLFGKLHRHPRNVYWILLARACLGYAAVSVDGNIESRGGQVWEAGTASSPARTPNKRELAKIAGHQMRFHSLVVERSDPALFQRFHHSRVYRYREFVFPHGDRIYPEYLLAVRREHR